MLQSLNNIPKIRVCIRKRPVNQKEQGKGDMDIITCQNNQVLVKEQKVKVDLTKYEEISTFNFDFSYSEQVSNEQIYQSCINPLVQAFFQGSKTTCFAYGQTGSGKTHTMLGNFKAQVPGLYILAANDIFKLLQSGKFNDMHITVSFYEIYCAKLYDLLNNKTHLPVREDKNQNINVVGLSEQNIDNVQQLMQIIEQGMTTRVTSSNQQNNTSSRSHAILQINLKKDNKKVYGKMNFVDLAGNERGNEVQNADKQTRVDGAEINKSLLSLKECIRALDQGNTHTPFRGSKLTLVLKESFMNKNCKLVMIGNISPTQSSVDYTLNTLRYSDRVKELKKPDNTNNNQQQIVNFYQSKSCALQDEYSNSNMNSSCYEDQSCPQQFNNYNNNDIKTSFVQDQGIKYNKQQQQMNQSYNQQQYLQQQQIQQQQYPNNNQSYNQYPNNQGLNVNINNQTNNFINGSYPQNYNFQNQQQNAQKQNDLMKNEFMQLIQSKNSINNNLQQAYLMFQNYNKEYLNNSIKYTKSQMALQEELEQTSNYSSYHIQQLTLQLQQQKNGITQLLNNIQQLHQIEQEDINLGNKIKLYQNQMQQQSQQNNQQNQYNQQPMQNSNYQRQQQSQYQFQQKSLAPQLFNFNNQNQNPNIGMIVNEDDLLRDDK